MSTTFLSAVNECLVNTNEVELTSSNFASAVGIHKSVKNFVNRAYLELCKEEVQWPFLISAASNINDPFSSTTYVETVAGTRWYLLKTGSSSILTDFSAVDWNSFQLTTQGVAGETEPYLVKNLTYIPFEEWNRLKVSSENEAAANDQTYEEPKLVFPSKDGRYFGLSGIPDQVYRVHFTAWAQPTSLSAHSDTLTIPDMYTPVLYDLVDYYIHIFKKEFQEATLKYRSYQKGLARMRRDLMGRHSDTMRDDRR